MASNAERRLSSILSNEDYGPKLARLRGEDTRYILRLIDQNKGKEARSEILRLDERRRAKERERKGKKKKRSTTPSASAPLSREQRKQQAISNILQRLGDRASRKRVTSNVELMDDDEIEFARNADLGDLVDKATRPAYVTTVSGVELNPFWYH